MTKLLYSPEAQQDLIDIKSYIDNDLKNPSAAKRTLMRITKSIRLLETAPQIGTPLSSIVMIDTDYRFLVAGNYISFYRYIKHDNTCCIDRIIYIRRDYISILFGGSIGLDEKPDKR